MQAKLASQDQRHQSELVDAVMEMQQAQSAAMAAVVTLERQLEQQDRPSHEVESLQQQHKRQLKAMQAETAADLESALAFERQKIREEAREATEASTSQMASQLRTANERIVDMAATIDDLKEQTPTKGKKPSSAAESLAGARESPIGPTESAGLRDGDAVQSTAPLRDAIVPGSCAGAAHPHPCEHFAHGR